MTRAPGAPRTWPVRRLDHLRQRGAGQEFGGFVYVNLDPGAAPLAYQSEGLGAEVDGFAPNVEELPHVGRIHYDIASSWKNVFDNFLD